MSIVLGSQRLLPWPVVFFPGFLCNQDAWQYHQYALRDVLETYTWVPQCELSFSQMAHAFLQSAPDKFVLVGISMGGMLAQEVIRIAPHRVCALALLSTAPQTPRNTEGFMLMLKKSQEYGIPSMIHDALSPYYLNRPRTPAMRRHFSSVYTLLMNMAVRLGLEAMASQVSALTQHPQEWYDTLKAVTIPSMVMFGTHDPICPPLGHNAIISALMHNNTQMKKDMSSHDLTKPSGRKPLWVRMLYNVGHMSALEQPSLTEYHLRLWFTQVARCYGLCR